MNFSKPWKVSSVLRLFMYNWVEFQQMKRNHSFQQWASNVPLRLVTSCSGSIFFSPSVSPEAETAQNVVFVFFFSSYKLATVSFPY